MFQDKTLGFSSVPCEQIACLAFAEPSSSRARSILICPRLQFEYWSAPRRDGNAAACGAGAFARAGGGATYSARAAGGFGVACVTLRPAVGPPIGSRGGSTAERGGHPYGTGGDAAVFAAAGFHAAGGRLSEHPVQGGKFRAGQWRGERLPCPGGGGWRVSAQVAALTPTPAGKTAVHPCSTSPSAGVSVATGAVRAVQTLWGTSPS